MTLGTFSIILDQKRKVLLCKRRDRDLWNLPGGRVEPGEAPWEAAIRETREEIGVSIEIERLIGIYMKPMQDDLVFQFLARITSGSPQESDEVCEIGYFEQEALPVNTSPRQKERINLFFSDAERFRMVIQ